MGHSQSKTVPAPNVNKISTRNATDNHLQTSNRIPSHNRRSDNSEINHTDLTNQKLGVSPYNFSPEEAKGERLSSLELGFNDNSMI